MESRRFPDISDHSNQTSKQKGRVCVNRQSRVRDQAGYSSVGRASDCRPCRYQMVPGSIPGGRKFSTHSAAGADHGDWLCVLENRAPCALHWRSVFWLPSTSIAFITHGYAARHCGGRIGHISQKRLPAMHGEAAHGHQVTIKLLAMRCASWETCMPRASLKRT